MMEQTFPYGSNSSDNNESDYDAPPLGTRNVKTEVDELPIADE